MIWFSSSYQNLSATCAYCILTSLVYGFLVSTCPFIALITAMRAKDMSVRNVRKIQKCLKKVQKRKKKEKKRRVYKQTHGRLLAVKLLTFGPQKHYLREGWSIQLWGHPSHDTLVRACVEALDKLTAWIVCRGSEGRLWGCVAQCLERLA